MKISLEEYRTNKFTCKRCKNNNMLPNKERDCIKGFRCQICGEINYPANQNTEKEIVIDIKLLEKLNKTELLEYMEKLIKGGS